MRIGRRDALAALGAAVAGCAVSARAGAQEAAVGSLEALKALPHRVDGLVRVDGYLAAADGPPRTYLGVVESAWPADDGYVVEGADGGLWRLEGAEDGIPVTAYGCLPTRPAAENDAALARAVALMRRPDAPTRRLHVPDLGAFYPVSTPVLAWDDGVLSADGLALSNGYVGPLPSGGAAVQVGLFARQDLPRLRAGAQPDGTSHAFRSQALDAESPHLILLGAEDARRIRIDDVVMLVEDDFGEEVAPVPSVTWITAVAEVGEPGVLRLRDPPPRAMGRPFVVNMTARTGYSKREFGDIDAPVHAARRFTLSGGVWRSEADPAINFGAGYRCAIDAVAQGRDGPYGNGFAFCDIRFRPGSTVHRRLCEVAIGSAFSTVVGDLAFAYRDGVTPVADNALQIGENAIGNRVTIRARIAFPPAIPWQPGAELRRGDLVRAGRNLYRAEADGALGPIPPPTPEAGTVPDGPMPLRWVGAIFSSIARIGGSDNLLLDADIDVDRVSSHALIAEGTGSGASGGRIVAGECQNFLRVANGGHPLVENVNFGGHAARHAVDVGDVAGGRIVGNRFPGGDVAFALPDAPIELSNNRIESVPQ